MQDTNRTGQILNYSTHSKMRDYELQDRLQTTGQDFHLNTQTN